MIHQHMEKYSYTPLSKHVLQSRHARSVRGKITSSTPSGLLSFVSSVSSKSPFLPLIHEWKLCWMKYFIVRDEKKEVLSHFPQLVAHDLLDSKDFNNNLISESQNRESDLANRTPNFLSSERKELPTAEPHSVFPGRRNCSRYASKCTRPSTRHSPATCWTRERRQKRAFLHSAGKLYKVV